MYLSSGLKMNKLSCLFSSSQKPTQNNCFFSYWL